MDNSNPGQHWQSAAPLSSSSLDAFSQMPRHRRNGLAVAVMFALGIPWAGTALADSCPSRHNTIRTSVAGCQLGAGERVAITLSGGVGVTEGAAVSQVDVINAQAGFLNLGSVEGEQGMLIRGGVFAGKWVNGLQGRMMGSDSALVIDQADVRAQIRNLGTLRTTGSGSYAVSTDGATLDAFNNGGIIEALGSAEGGVSMRDTLVRGELRNSGRIGGSASSEGLVFQGGEVRGAVLNSGRLEGSSTAFEISDASILGDVRSSGLITSGAEGAVISDSHVFGRFVNSGRITSGMNALRIEHAVIDGGFVNTGTVSSSAGIDISDSVLGSFINTGELTAQDGDTHLTQTLVKGDFINRGTIATGRTGANGLSISGGSIEGGLFNTGTLDGGSFASGLFMNEGAVIVGDLRNTGVAQGRTGMEFRNAHVLGSLVNSGSVLGAVDNFEDNGTGLLAVNSDIGGNLVNSGVISGFDAGVRLTNVKVAGDIVNSGYIVGSEGGGLDLETTSAQRLVIRGSVTGQDTALSIEEGSHVKELAVYGELFGFETAVTVDDDSTLDTLTIGGTETVLHGQVEAPNTRAYITSNALFRLTSRDPFSIKSLLNRGTLSLVAPETGLRAARVIGDYTQASGAVLQTEVSNAQSYGQLTVSGTATLGSNARIDVKLLNSGTAFNVDRLADVLSAGNLVSDGTFKVTSNSALFNFNAAKDGNTLDLTLAAKGANGVAEAASAAGLKQAAGAAAVVDRQLNLGAASTLTPYFVGASSQAEVAATLAQSVPVDNSALRTSQAALSAIGQVVQSRMSLGRADSTNAGLWQQPFNYSGNRTNASGAAGGSVIGVDTALSSTHRVGLAFAYADGSAGNGGSANSLAVSQQRDQLDLWQFLGYSSHRLDANTEWMLYGGAGNSHVNAERTLSTSVGSGTAHARYDSLVATVGSSLAQTYSLSDSTQLVPSVRLDFNHVYEGSYQERGANGLQPLLLDVAARDTEQLIAGFDARLEQRLAPRTQLRVNLGVGYDLLNADGDRQAAFAGAADQWFTVSGERASPWLTRAGVGVASTFRNGSEMSLSWDAQSRSDYTDQAATLSAKMPF